MQIKNRFTGDIIFEDNSDSIKKCVLNALSSEADLSGANLPGANLSWANLSEANLSGANLPGANLSEANLSGANLSGANLFRANLSEANLSEADLSEANLFRANLSGVDGIFSQSELLEKNFEWTSDGLIAYKQFGLHYTKPNNWAIREGSVIQETPNTNRQDNCGCGISVGTKEWILENGQNHRTVWKVLIRNKWLAGVTVPYIFDGKIRCEKVELIEMVNI